jgi:hypothetical protein
VTARATIASGKWQEQCYRPCDAKSANGRATDSGLVGVLKGSEWVGECQNGGGAGLQADKGRKGVANVDGRSQG